MPASQHGTQHPAIWCHHIRPAGPDSGFGPVVSRQCEWDRTCSTADPNAERATDEQAKGSWFQSGKLYMTCILSIGVSVKILFHVIMSNI